MNLSKSKYCAGMQCPKILWMDKNMPDQKAEQDKTRLEIGQKVGELAGKYFGEYSEVKYDRDNPNNMRDMLAKTRELLDAGTKTITEATFSFDNNFCMVDILRKTDDGYEIIEVKSSSGTSDDDPKKTKDVYQHDMAYQYYVVSKAGLNISKVSLMQLNKGYVRQGELNIKELFALVDCTEEILKMQDDIPNNIESIASVVSKKDEPNEKIGSRCEKPYECGYKGWCFRHLPENNVFDIGWRMWGSKKDKLFEEGLRTFEDVYNSSHELSDKPALQVRTVVENLPPHIEADGIKKFLSELSYPLYHLDFETYQDAIPQWDGTKPYQQIPFQYSIHIQDAPGAQPKHLEFLGKEGKDPRRKIAEQLCAEIPPNVCVLAYNMSFEKMCIKSLAEAFPDLSERLMNIHGNIKDLMIPFSQGYYYSRDMGGSASIKEVLPALLGYDPYDELTIVRGGGDAMTLFPILHTKKPEEIEQIRSALLAYCKLDTQAMVWVLDKLYEMI